MMNTKQTLALLLRGAYIHKLQRPLFVQVIPCKDIIDTGNDKQFYTRELVGSSDEDLSQQIDTILADWQQMFPDTLPYGILLTLPDTKEKVAYYFCEDMDMFSTTIKIHNKVRPLSVTESRPSQESVHNKIALVTGGSQGIGAEIVHGLIAQGMIVFVADVNVSGAEILCAKINKEKGSQKSTALFVDVTNEESVQKMLLKVVDTVGGIDLIVSNAGVLRASSVLEQSADDFRFVSDVNYLGFFHICKHGGLILRCQSRTAKIWYSDIVQINSKSGLQGSNKNASYSGSKFGSIGLVQSFALELVEWKIKVNAICPGNFFDGPLWSNPDNGLFVQYLRSGKVPGAKCIDDVRRFYEEKIPMGRGCTGKDVLKALLYLVAQEYETGQALPVTGGQIMLH